VPVGPTFTQQLAPAKSLAHWTGEAFAGRTFCRHEPHLAMFGTVQVEVVAVRQVIAEDLLRQR
jgi:hypothetical protein